MVLTRKQQVDVGELLSKIDPWVVFRYYAGEFIVGTSTNQSPFVHQQTPSFGIYLKDDGKLYYNDFSDESVHGDHIQLVQQLFGLSYIEAIMKIANDFGLLESGTEQYKRITAQYVKPVLDIKRHSLIHVSVRKWQKRDIEYWEQYGISLEQLKADRVYSLKEWSLNRRRQYIAPDELAFCYVYDTGYKIYLPGRKKDDGKWTSNISTSLVENTQVIRDNDRIVVTKAKKCRLYLSTLMPGVINVQNESRAGFSEELIEMLKGKEVLVQYDSDSPGKKNSMKLTKELGYKHLNCPDHLLEVDVKDFSDWRKHDGHDRNIIEFLKQKQVI